MPSVHGTLRPAKLRSMVPASPPAANSPARPSPSPPATSPVTSPAAPATSQAASGTRPVTGWLAGKDWTVLPTSRRVVALTFDAGAPVVTSRVLGAARPGEIVLMHAGSNPDDHATLDADALPQLISGLRAQGYSFVTLARSLAEPARAGTRRD
jgi:peptidoglycan/xylan/chitin deacetylase (PgdA/CDA1 family)